MAFSFFWMTPRQMDRERRGNLPSRRKKQKIRSLTLHFLKKYIIFAVLNLNLDK